MNKDALGTLTARLDGILDPGGDAIPARALVVHLDSESSESVSIPANWLRTYVSGPALAARLWSAFAGEDADNPLSYEADNPVVITSSSLIDSEIQFNNSCAIAFRSPQTKGLYFNVGSISFGTRLAMFGYRALVLCGRLRRTSHVKVNLDGVQFEASEKLALMRVSQVAALVQKGSVIIGPAGENQVPYATASCDGMPTGRGGLGYVLGLKNVKVLSLGGSFDIPVEAGNSDPALDEMRRSGSHMSMKTASGHGWAPVDNFRMRTDPRLFHLTSDEADRRWGKEPSEKKKHKFMYLRKTAENKVIPDYTANVMLGSNLNCFDPVTVMERYNLALDLGLDVVSLGNILGWAKQSEQLRMDYSDNSQILPVIEGIGNGTLRLVPSGTDPCYYAINGLECGPFDYRGNFPEAVNQALGNWFPVYFAMNPDLSGRNTAFWVELNEELVMGLESLGISPSMLIPLVFGPKGLKLRILANSKKRARDCYRLSELAKSLSKDPDYITGLGKRCRRLVREINALLTDSKPGIPNHFCVDPESNCSVQTIVPIRSLLESYFTLFDYCTAVQDAGADKKTVS